MGADARGQWGWSRLPSFPYRVSMHAAASIGTRLYVQGGACYNRKAFFNFADCDGLGSRFYEENGVSVGTSRASISYLVAHTGPDTLNS